MENIIRKSIEGGYIKPIDKTWYEMYLDPLFWQSLGKACRWEEPKPRFQFDSDNSHKDWKSNALRFHEINLAEGWSKAVEWLENLIKEQ
jgi:hypothetical protein